MHYQISKKLFIFLFVILVSTLLNVSHAQITVDNKCSNLGAKLDNNPSPLLIVCPVVRILNIMVYSVGAIFVVMIIYGAIKLAMSLGDPKGYQAAQQTWFWAVIGLAVVVGFFSIMLVINNLLGLSLFSGNSPTSIFDNLLTALYNLFSAVGIENL